MGLGLRERQAEERLMNTVDCPDIETFQAALRGAKLRYVLRAKPERNWQLASAELAGIGVMSAQEGAANFCTGAAATGFFNAFIPLGERQPFVIDGQRLEGGTVAWMAPDCSFRCTSSEPAGWLRVTLPRETVLSWFASHEDEADPGLLTRNRVGPSDRPAAELIRLAHGVLQGDAERGDSVRGTPGESAARHEIRDAVLRSIVPAADDGRETRHVAHGARVLDRALAYISAQTEGQVHIDDLCRVTGVSERTLRNVFYRNLGMSPHQYLMVARLHDVRSAIRVAGPDARVSAICADFGIWDFGRFAGQYRRLFGVLPSQELATRRRDAVHERLPREGTWRSSVLRGYSPKIA
jgi:AraC family ethanolamine operon transcriptional activator